MGGGWIKISCWELFEDLLEAVQIDDRNTINILFTDRYRNEPRHAVQVLHAACGPFGHLGLVKELLQDPRIDPSAYNNTCIRNAWITQNFDVVDFLLRNKKVQEELFKHKQNKITH